MLRQIIVIESEGMVIAEEYFIVCVLTTLTAGLNQTKERRKT